MAFIGVHDVIMVWKFVLLRHNHSIFITSIVKVIFKMDLWLNPSRSNEPTSKCDFCYQTGVPVKKLKCGIHFYCGVCEKFAPKFYKRADYTCSRCPGPRRSHRQSLDLDLSPTTLNVRPVKKKQDFKEVTIAVEGGNIISFGGKLLAVKFQFFSVDLIYQTLCVTRHRSYMMKVLVLII